MELLLDNVPGYSQKDLGQSVKTLQGLGMLGESVVLRVQESVSSMVQ